jgi:hypothetical protein
MTSDGFNRRVGLPKLTRLARGKIARATWIVAFVLCLAAALSVSPSDEAAARGFLEQAGRWQNNPEFRGVAMDYCVRGSRALRTRPFMIPARSLVLGVRSLPGMPKQYAVNETSFAHYDAFSRGPLSAYLFLCDEQSVPSFVSALEDVGLRGEPRRFLDAFHMDAPVCKDAGAVSSVTALVRDTSADKPFVRRENVGPMLLPHVGAVARELGVPEDPKSMTPDQQGAVLERLDDSVRAADPELWRTTQLNDFCCGVWAPVCGPEYSYVITPLLTLHQLGWVGMILLLVVWLRRRRLALLQGREDRVVERGPGDHVAGGLLVDHHR